MSAAIPVVDLAPLRAGDRAGARGVIGALDAACRTHGFFYVAGHGVPAAHGAATLKTLLAQAGERHADPAEILAHVDPRFAAASAPGTFATMFLAAWRPASGRLVYASAGHEPGLLLSADGHVRELGATGLPLGVGDDTRWEAAAVPVRCIARVEPR